MANFPCTVVPEECGCDSNPSRNLSALAVDLPTFTGIEYVSLYPPLGTRWQSHSCVGVCTSTVSQTEADQCAQRLGQSCASGDWRGPDGGPQNPPVPPPVDTAGSVPYAQVLNTPQTCTVPCPDGSTFSFTTPFGTFGSVAQVGPAAAQALAQANAKAKSYACNQANLRKVCITGNLPAACVGQPYSGTITATGKFISAAPATDFWEIIFGAVPPGMTFHGGNVSGGTVLIDGTPTTAANEDYVFMVRVTDTFGGQQIKVFGITVGGITNLPPPAGSVGVAYSYQLTFAGFTSPLVTADVLPDGLTMDTSGLIQGTPINAQKVNTIFTVEDGARTCQQSAVMTVTAPSGINFNDLVWDAPNLSPGVPAGGTLSGSSSQDNFQFSAKGADPGQAGGGTSYVVILHGTMTYNGPATNCNMNCIRAQLGLDGNGPSFITLTQDGNPIFNGLNFDGLALDTPFVIADTLGIGSAIDVQVQGIGTNGDPDFGSGSGGIQVNATLTPAF